MMRLSRAAWMLGVGLALIAPGVLGQTDDPGRRTFEIRCAGCHGADGTGGAMGPSIVLRLSGRDDQQLGGLIRTGLPDRGMPPSLVADSEMAALVKFLRTIPGRSSGSAAPRTFQTIDGKSLEGRVLGEGADDVQLRTMDGRVHLLRRAGDRVREVTSEMAWPTYNGDAGGNRHTTLTQIDSTTVARLAPQWVFTMPNARGLQGTPVVVGGIMYVTAPNECIALDAGSGRQIWRFQRPRTPGVAGGNANRGVGVSGDRVFLETDDAHILALDRFTGVVLRETALADWRDNYAASSAPLPAGNLVISGVSGGEHGANGFVAAHDQATGQEVWRFSTVPKRGQPGSETWQGKDIDHGGAPTWFTGSYDRELDLVYWPVGNPSKEYNGDHRLGDNLYSNCILALDRKTGTLRWHYQFTPHDLWDWDATQTSVLVDADWQGRPRKLMLHASRNGFFYVFDRSDGTLLLAKPFVRNLTWASGIGADGRPVKLPGQDPTPAGTKVCPSQDGATNWFSPSFNPATGLYYVQTFEKCSIYTKSDGGEWESGKSYLGGSQRTAPDPIPQRVLKAINIRTGAIAWELPQAGPGNSWGGTLSTATGLVIFGEEGGALMAADAITGKPLWSFPTNHSWKASPMTYMFDGKQYVAVAAGSNIIAFGLTPGAAPPAAQSPFPQAEISNGRIRAKLYLPDAQSGYYRATRFDWSGIISSLDWNGHSYFGQWFQRHDPKIHDAITGPVEEFQGLGYDDAKPGESFVRIGVGAVRKPDEPRYRQFSTYEIVDPGRWTVTKGRDWIEFVQQLGDTAGYSYVYRKKLRLSGDTLVLEHRLKNIGRKTIATSVYNHDFFMLDGQPTGPDFVVRMAFEPTATAPLNGLAEIRGKDFVYLQELQARQSLQTELKGFGATAKDYDFRLENRKTGAGVRQTGDRPMSKFNLWSPRTTICPEAFIDLRIEPGREVSWRISYEFYQATASSKRQKE